MFLTPFIFSMRRIPYFKINDYPGRFILFEGINGSGKTTQAHLIEEALVERGLLARYNHEPSDFLIGTVIREIIERRRPTCTEKEWIDCLTKIIPVNSGAFKAGKVIFKQFLNGKPRTNEESKRQFLFMLDRMLDLREIIEPTLKRGGWVIQDRYDISCYLHGIANGLRFYNLAKKHSLLLKEKYLGPNLIFFYWLPISVAWQRLAKSGKTIDLYENRSTLKKIEKAARWLFSLRFQLPKPGKPIVRKLRIKNQKMKVIIINAEPSVDQVFDLTWKYLEPELEKYEKMCS